LYSGDMLKPERKTRRQTRIRNKGIKRPFPLFFKAGLLGVDIVAIE